MLRTAAVAVAIVTASVLAGAESAPLAISGEVKGASGRYPIRILLWDRPGFLQKPVQERLIAAGSPARYSFSVPRGSWAVSAFEDRNGNGILDIGLFGPKEPTAFWRLFTKWRQPEFDEVAITVEGDRTDAHIVLK